VNKDVLLIINLKRQVQDLKDTLQNKDHEILLLNKDIKSTKIRELEMELRTYMQECLRLRAITQQSIKLSGEIDLKRMQRQL
jgi:precorrin-2 methylase